MDISREVIETIIGTKIGDPSIYQRAFFHKSVLHTVTIGDGSTHGLITESYERMEFMGDAVINFIVTRYLFEKYPHEDEGFLTRIRTKVVSGKCLCRLARNLGLHNHVKMNEKAMANGWNCNDRILEDVFEALVGCIYLDLGVMVAKEFLIRTIEQYIDFQALLRDDNYKDILMRFTQANGVPLPFYASHEIMIDGKKAFEVRVIVNNTPCGYGRNKNKKQAEQNAARQALLYHNVEV